MLREVGRRLGEQRLQHASRDRSHYRNPHLLVNLSLQDALECRDDGRLVGVIATAASEQEEAAIDTVFSCRDASSRTRDGAALHASRLRRPLRDATPNGRRLAASSDRRAMRRGL